MQSTWKVRNNGVQKYISVRILIISDQITKSSNKYTI